MPIFHYHARDADGRIETGEIDARNSIDAANQLRRRGLRLERLDNPEDLTAAFDSAEARAPMNRTEPAPESPRQESALPDASIGMEDMIELAGRIAGITRSHLPLTPGLRALAEELPSRTLRRGLNVLCTRLEQGEPLDEALQQTPVIPRHIGGLIMSGVRTGRLGEMMDWFLRHVRRQMDLRRRCRGSVLYPAIVMAAGLGAMAFVLTWIVPEFRRIFQDFGTEVPTITMQLFAMSDLVVGYGAYLLVAVAASVAVAVTVFGVASTRVFRHRLLASTPFVGTMFRCSALAAFCELLSLFVLGRLPFADAVRLAGEGCGDADLDVRFHDIADCLEQGQDDTELFRRLTHISPQLLHAFQWKDREGTFVEALGASSRIYESQAQMQITVGGMVLEPVVILVVLGSAAWVALALFMPLIKLLNELS